MTKQATGRIPTFTIGDRLRKSRLSMPNALDVRAFADLIGVSHGTVSRYELEALPAEKMKPVVLRAWAMATGVDYEWLRGGNQGDPRLTDSGEGPDVRPERFERSTHWIRDNVVPLRPRGRSDRSTGPRGRAA